VISGDTRAVVLLGAQRFDPTLGAAVAELGVEGRIAAITAGWQEREDEDDELREHLGGRTINLRLHARAEEVFRKDPQFAAAHRERQAILRHRQDFYRIRLEHALDAQHVIANRAAPKDILEDEARASIQEIRDIDRMHLERCVLDHQEFEARWKPLEREAVAEQVAEIRELVRGCDAIAIAGGHVASLLNRLRLFDIGRLAAGKVVFAWCGGAMVVSERVVLFHHSPPQGPGAAEVLDEGLSLVGDVVCLPQPELRLRLDDRERIRVMARRFAPATCLALPARSRVTWLKRGPTNPHGVLALRDDGMHTAFEASGEVSAAGGLGT
jgi:hypothetical protein